MLAGKWQPLRANEKGRIRFQLWMPLIWIFICIITSGLRPWFCLLFEISVLEKRNFLLNVGEKKRKETK